MDLQGRFYACLYELRRRVEVLQHWMVCPYFVEVHFNALYSRPLSWARYTSEVSVFLCGLFYPVNFLSPEAILFLFLGVCSRPAEYLISSSVADSHAPVLLFVLCMKLSLIVWCFMQDLMAFLHMLA